MKYNTAETFRAALGARYPRHPPIRDKQLNSTLDLRIKPELGELVWQVKNGTPNRAIVVLRHYGATIKNIIGSRP